MQIPGCLTLLAAITQIVTAPVDQLPDDNVDNTAVLQLCLHQEVHRPQAALLRSHFLGSRPCLELSQPPAAPQKHTGKKNDPHHVIGLLNQSIQLYLSLPFDDVDWFNVTKNGTFLIPKKEYDGHILILQNGTLIIHGLKKEDSGLYTARITHSGYSIVRINFNLTVYERVPQPAIRIGWKKRTRDWCNMTLHCSVPTNTSVLLSYTWMYRLRDTKYQVYNNGDTTQVSLRPESWGMELLCVVHNPADQKNVSLHVCADPDNKAENQDLNYLWLLLLPIIILVPICAPILWKKYGKAAAVFDGAGVGDASESSGRFEAAPQAGGVAPPCDVVVPIVSAVTGIGAIPSLVSAPGVGVDGVSEAPVHIKVDPAAVGMAPLHEGSESVVLGASGDGTIASLVSAPGVGVVGVSEAPVHIEVVPAAVDMAPLHEVAESVVLGASGDVSGAVPSLVGASGVGEAGTSQDPVCIEVAPPAVGATPLHEIVESVVLGGSGAVSGAVPSLVGAPGVGEAGASQDPVCIEIAGGATRFCEVAESVVPGASGAVSGAVPSLVSASGVGDAEVPACVEVAPPAVGTACSHEVAAESIIVGASGAVYKKNLQITESMRQNDYENLKYPIQETDTYYSTVNKKPAVNRNYDLAEFINIHSISQDGKFIRVDLSQKCEEDDLPGETDCLLLAQRMK
ncbi:uncharacterized protein LOC134980383 isoform X2 [Pseudophryne corroboree]|uniref:uncharacterized protein LOC134980383 isoform X2 n=1 Tax=Pseudophryne corroboree TaxID=495146 RepID=UPI003081B9B8